MIGLLRGVERREIRLDALLPKAEAGKMWEGMCTACGDDGAIAAYRRAASSALDAIDGLSHAWMM